MGSVKILLLVSSWANTFGGSTKHIVVDYTKFLLASLRFITGLSTRRVLNMVSIGVLSEGNKTFAINVIKYVNFCFDIFFSFLAFISGPSVMSGSIALLKYSTNRLNVCLLLGIDLSMTKCKNSWKRRYVAS